MIARLWFIFALLLPFSTQEAARIDLGGFSVHPCLAALAAIGVYLCWRPGAFAWKRVRSLAAWLGLFLLAMLISLLINAPVFGISPMSVKIAVKWFIFFLSVVMVAGSLSSLEEVLLLTKGVVLAMMIISAYGLVHWIFANQMYDFLNPFWQVATQNAFSNWTAGVFILALYLFSAGKALPSRIFWLLALLLIVIAQVLTLSRFGWLLILVSFAVFILLQRCLKAAFFSFLLLLVLSWAIPALIPEQFRAQIQRRARTMESPRGISSSMLNRFSYGEKALEIFAANPVFGIGAGNYERYQARTRIKHDPRIVYLTPEENIPEVRIKLPKDSIIAVVEDKQAFLQAQAKGESGSSHSVFLNLLSENGFLGSLIAFLLLAGMLGRGWRVCRSGASVQQRSLVLYLGASALMYLFRGLTSHEVLFMPVSGFIFGLYVAGIFILEENPDR